PRQPAVPSMESTPILNRCGSPLSRTTSRKTALAIAFALSVYLVNTASEPVRLAAVSDYFKKNSARHSIRRFSLRSQHRFRNCADIRCLGLLQEKQLSP